jgi:GntR family histidine utilization transcriptional repressor
MEARAIKSNSAMPRYEQVKRLILKQIQLAGGNEEILLPSENELVRTLKVSRMTVSRALRELAAEGWVTRVQGVGTFSAGQKPELSVIDVRSISDEIEARGNEYSCTVKLLAEEKASKEVAADLDLAPGSRVYHSILVHRENASPIQIENRFVNPRAAPDYLGVDFKKVTPHHYLMRTAPLTDAEHLIESGFASSSERKLLELLENEPCLLVKRRTWSGSLICSTTMLIHPGSRYRLVSRLPRSASSRTAANQNGSR